MVDFLRLYRVVRSGVGEESRGDLDKTAFRDGQYIYIDIRGDLKSKSIGSW